MIGMYNREFQMCLVANLAKSPELFKRASAFLRISDFDLPACQLVYEAVYNYYHKQGKLPDFKTLELEVIYTLNNVGGNAATHLLPEEYESVAQTMQAVAFTPVDEGYYADKLPEYLQFIRTNQAVTSHSNRIRQGQVGDFLTEVASINSEVSMSSDREAKLEFMDEVPEVMMQVETSRRVGTGLGMLDIYTAGGLGRGEMGMVTACPGVGKTTSLINFMRGAVKADHEALFFTLELAGHRIKHRYQAIMGNINANYLKMPVPDWPREELFRYSQLLDSSNPWFNKAAIVDMSKKAHTCHNIEEYIKAWKQAVYDRGGDPSTCSAVYVDWLDKINSGGLGLTTNSRDDMVLVRVTEELSDMCRRHDVALWTATQGTREADGRESLGMKHVAHGYHKNDALDVSLGLGVLTDMNGATNEGIMASASKEAVECKRNLQFSIMKNRDNPQTNIQFYQGPTLRYWDNLTAETAMTRSLATSTIADAEKELENAKFLTH